MYRYNYYNYNTLKIDEVIDEQGMLNHIKGLLNEIGIQYTSVQVYLRNIYMYK